MERKVFISILGTGFYKKCIYTADGFSCETNFIQQALIKYIDEKYERWKPSDEAIIFLTQKARKDNWNKDIKERFCQRDGTTAEYHGLEEILDNMGIAFRGVDIDDGKDNRQMWNIFESIFGQIQEGDRLFVDVTHSFRYLPMLLIVLTNYAKLLKNVSVEAILYGNFEARDTETNTAPIMDLTQLSLLQDWTVAVSDYLQYGHIEHLERLSKESLKPILRNPETRTNDTKSLRDFINRLKMTVDDIITCRGEKIMKGDNVRMLKKKANEIEDIAIVQMKPVFSKIKDSLNDFVYDSTNNDDKEVNNIRNSIKAAKWCYSNKLYQQAITLLEEGVITLLCHYEGLDYYNPDERGIITKCIKIKNSDIPEDKWDTKNAIEHDKIKTILNNSNVWEDKAFILTLGNIMTLRNDYNHAGLNKNNNPSGAAKIISNIEKLTNSIEIFFLPEKVSQCHTTVQAVNYQHFTL